MLISMATPEADTISKTKFEYTKKKHKYDTLNKTIVLPRCGKEVSVVVKMEKIIKIHLGDKK